MTSGRSPPLPRTSYQIVAVPALNAFPGPLGFAGVADAAVGAMSVRVSSVASERDMRASGERGLAPARPWRATGGPARGAASHGCGRCTRLLRDCTFVQ